MRGEGGQRQHTIDAIFTKGLQFLLMVNYLGKCIYIHRTHTKVASVQKMDGLGFLPEFSRSHETVSKQYTVLLSIIVYCERITRMTYMGIIIIVIIYICVEELIKIPYSQQHWWELNLVVDSQIAIASIILVDL